jgi:hypothetical protein
MKTGIEIIAEERNRHTIFEGWTPEHDDNHREGQLAEAAACYAIAHKHREATKPCFWRWGSLISGWPWHDAWWKPSPDNRIKELAKAGALIAAEIDRLNRITPDQEAGKYEKNMEAGIRTDYLSDNTGE